MTNEEIRTAMWEAYVEGAQVNVHWCREDFNDWLKKEFPELLEKEPITYDDTESSGY